MFCGSKFMFISYLVLLVVALVESSLYSGVLKPLNEENERASNTSNIENNVQSPIAITLKTSKILENEFQPLEFHGHWNKDGDAFIENTGRYAEIIFENRTEQPYISGGLLLPTERYIFEQMHFHWGETDNIGSEHVLDGKTYSMEAHLVHFNSKYDDFKSAIAKKDGVVVIAFFIQASDGEKCEYFAKITDQIENIRELYSKTPLESDCLKWMSLQELDKHYFTYHGSLTTEPYNECVTWIIYRTPVFVPKQQVAAFRDLKSTDNTNKITKNCRSIQTPEQAPSVIFTGTV